VPYRVEWLVENRVIYMAASGVVTLDDIKNANKEIMAKLETGRPFVHLITDASRIEKNAIGLNDLLTVIRTIPSSPNLGWSIYVGKNKIDRFFASVATQISKARNREFDNLQAAIDFLIENDDSLPDIQLPK
jgi:hypothetical protein